MIGIASLEASQVEVVADVGGDVQEEEVKDHAHVLSEDVAEHITAAVKGLVEITGEDDQEGYNGGVTEPRDAGNYNLSNLVSAEFISKAGGVLDEEDE